MSFILLAGLAFISRREGAAFVSGGGGDIITTTEMQPANTTNVTTTPAPTTTTTTTTTPVPTTTTPTFATTNKIPPETVSGIGGTSIFTNTDDEYNYDYYGNDGTEITTPETTTEVERAGQDELCGAGQLCVSAA